MHRNTRIKVIIPAAVILMLLFTLTLQAQEHSRRAQPAYPIGAGEKMLVISGDSFNADSDITGGSFFIFPDQSAHTFGCQVKLPVGTTLKRMIVEASDIANMTDADINIDLTRRSNSLPQYAIVLRRVNTSGVSSGTLYDTKQLISNPMSHVMQQGWTYWIQIRAVSPLKVGASEILVNVIKIIYEP